MLAFMEDIIRHAGALSLDYRERLASLLIERKRDKDLVTEADRAVEDLLTEQIQRQYPEHAIYGEERGETAGREGRWIIDPIDGTTSFLHRQPHYAISIGYEEHGELMRGAVFLPAMNELFLAEKGAGATLNGKSIRCTTTADLGDSILASGFACVRAGMKKTNIPMFAAVIPHVRDVRRYGSAASDLCYVACGRLEGFWELQLKWYDIAGGLAILREAGGRCSDLNGGQENLPNEVVATNGPIHEVLLQMLRQASPFV